MAVSDEAQINKITVDLERFTEGQVKRVGLSIMNNLYMDTPVDTGFARSNWHVSYGTPQEAIAGSKESVTDTFFSAGLAMIEAWSMGLGSIYITNSVPYIGRLNDGWSKQAPSSFVQMAVARALASAKAAVDYV